MAQLLHRKVLLGVSGGIAAYKSATLVRLLVKAGADVQVVMTPSAHEFITPLTLATLSKRPVLTDLVDRSGNGTWNDHVALAHWADVMLIAPATANTLSKMAAGLCDNLLLACYLSIPPASQGQPARVFVAPAMDLEMYAHQSTQRNLDILGERGVVTLGPDSGELASGLEGLGRMSGPEALLDALVEALLKPASPLNGKRLLITAGPTHEAIDPVRFIGNRSSGRMGFALAEEAAWRGAQVELISGPVDLVLERPGITRTNVVSAAEMAAAAKERFPACDLAILSAAVADATPAVKSGKKLKKDAMGDRIDLEPTEDILAWMGADRTMAQRLVGFALETDNELDNAISKLERKGLDLIVLNSLRDAGAGFGHDTNKVTLIGRDKKPQALPLMSKREVARAILDRTEALMENA